MIDVIDVIDVSDVHSLSGAYALDALEDFEVRAFERHLAGCAVCRQEVRELQDAAAAIAVIEQAVPPEALRERVLAEVARTPQARPVVPRARQERTGEGSAARGSSRSSGSAEHFPTSPRRRLLAPLAAAAAVIAIAAGGVALNANRSDDAAPLAATVHQVFTASDAHRTSIETTNGGHITVATSRALGEMAVDTHGLPALSAEKVYQVWTLRDGGYPTSFGTIDATQLPSGTTMDMPGKGLQVAITVEPRGGSDVPTSEPVIAFDPQAV